MLVREPSFSRSNFLREQGPNLGLSLQRRHQDNDAEAVRALAPLAIRILFSNLIQVIILYFNSVN